MKHRIALFCLIFSMFLCSQPSQGEDKTLVMAIDISRHGDRPPIKNVSKLSEKEWGNNIDNLTELGAKNSYKKGESLKDYYINKMHFINSTPSHDEIYIASSNTQRTIETAKNTINGMLGNYANNLKLDIINSESSLLRRTQDQKELLDKSNDHIPTDLETELLTIKKNIEKKTNTEIKKLKDVITLGDTLYVNRIHGKTRLENIIGKEISNRIIKIWQDVYITKMSLNKFSCAWGKELLSHINRRFSDKIHDQPSPKLILLFAHDMTLSGTLSLLDKLPQFIPPYNSDLRFELYKEGTTNQYFVKTSLNDQLIRICDSEYCEYKDFHEKVEKNLIQKCNGY